MRSARQAATTILAGVIGCLLGAVSAVTGTVVAHAQVSDVSIDEPFTDDFSDPAGGWDTTEDGSVRYVDGAYVITSAGRGLGSIGRAHRIFHDVEFEVVATQLSGPAEGGTTYGLACRLQPDGSGYHFRVSDAGEAGLVREEFGWDAFGNWSLVPSWLVEWHRVDAVVEGNATNVLRAVCAGDHLALYVNDVLAVETWDSTFQRGDLGLEATSYGDPDIHGPVEVRFDDAAAVLADPSFTDAPTEIPLPASAEESNALLVEAIRLSGRNDYRGMILRLQAVLAYAEAPEGDVAIANVVTVHQLMGQALMGLSEYSSARERFELALTIARDIGGRWLEARQLHGLAQLDAAVGDYTTAIDHYHQSLEIDREIAETDGEAMTLGDLGNVYLAIADYEQALSQYQLSLEIPNASGIRLREASNHGRIGNVYFAMGDYRLARDHYEQALEIFETWGDWQGTLATLGNLANVDSVTGDLPAAIANYERSLAGARGIGDRAGEAITLSNLGDLHRRLGEYELAEQHLLEAKQIASQIGARDLIATTLVGLGSVYRDAGDGASALEAFGEGAALAGEIGAREVEATAITGAGGVQEDGGDPDAALALYLRAIEVRETIRRDLSVASFLSAAAERSADVYRRAVRLLVAEGRNDEAFALAEQSRARAFLDAMGNARPELGGAAAGLIEEETRANGILAALERDLAAERSRAVDQQDAALIGALESRIVEAQRDYEDLLDRLQVSSAAAASLVQVTTATVADVQAALDDDTALVAYYLTDESSLAFVVTATGFDVVELPMTPDEVASAVEGFRTFGLADLGVEHHRSLTELYAGLVAPLELDTTSVGVIAHQALNYVPFAALGDGDELFVSRHQLFSVPSASSFLVIADRAGRSTDASVVIGDPAADAPNLPRLSYAATEAQEAGAVLGVEPLIGAEATESALRISSGGAGIVHIAAHGTFSPGAPLFSRLWLTPDGDDDGRLNVYEVYGLDLGRTDLVVLSACETQVGELSDGDEVIGLNRAFLYGAATVMATLWSVDDEVTGALMQRFFTNLDEGMGKAQALQAAQRSIRTDPDHPAWAHPYYWAAFVLNGDPGNPMVQAEEPPASTTLVSEAAAADDRAGDGNSGALILGGAALVLAAVAAGAVGWRRRSQ